MAHLIDSILSKADLLGSSLLTLPPSYFWDRDSEVVPYFWDSGGGVVVIKKACAAEAKRMRKKGLCMLIRGLEKRFRKGNLVS